ncbi:MAG: aromatic amino acid lyase, partial [Acidobacteriaceae bacterium]|nr:aromatic amino acid lyase [Acidobacteriaceae bacterium]
MLELSGQNLTLDEIVAVSIGNVNPGLSELARERIQASRNVIKELIREGRVVYGVNTGFGKLSDVHIPESD